MKESEVLNIYLNTWSGTGLQGCISHFSSLECYSFVW